MRLLYKLQIGLKRLSAVVVWLEAANGRYYGFTTQQRELYFDVLRGGERVERRPWPAGSDFDSGWMRPVLPPIGVSDE